MADLSKLDPKALVDAYLDARSRLGRYRNSHQPVYITARPGGWFNVRSAGAGSAGLTSRRPSFERDVANLMERVVTERERDHAEAMEDLERAHWAARDAQTGRGPLWSYFVREC